MVRASYQHLIKLNDALPVPFGFSFDTTPQGEGNLMKAWKVQCIQHQISHLHTKIHLTDPLILFLSFSHCSHPSFLQNPSTPQITPFPQTGSPSSPAKIPPKNNTYKKSKWNKNHATPPSDLGKPEGLLPVTPLIATASKPASRFPSDVL